MSRAAGRFKAAVTKLPELTLDGCSASERTWREHANEIRRCALEGDVRKFLTWRPIASTMCTRGHADWSLISRQYLQSLPDWESRWKSAIAEVPVGDPAYHGASPPTSSALITAAHCLALLEQKIGVKASDFSFVLEFGGGYGCLCRTLRSVGFLGDYVNFDQPIVAALSFYYLTEVGLLPSEHSIDHVTDLDKLERLVEGKNLRDSLFVSTWALSEAPIPLRLRMLSLAARFRYIYLIYQPKFYEVDNLAFFGALPSVLQDIRWQRWDIEHLGATALAGVTGH